MAIGEEIIAEELAKLPQAKLARLGEITSAYRGVPLEKLPGDLKREATEILWTVHKAARPNMNSSGQSTSRETTLQSQKNARQDHDETTPQAHKDYSKLYSIIGTDLHQKEMDIAISQNARQQGLYIIGANGTGKSTLLANLILTDIRESLAGC
jgi:ATPase subunit of ABC transporter with duplicated ATPase domains